MSAGGKANFAVRIFRGMAWSLGSVVSARVLVLVWTAVLAHLLSPRDFGLVALALIFTTVLDAFRDLGVNDALVVSPEHDVAEHASTAFWLTALAAVGLAGVIAALSPLIADFFHQPRLMALLAVLGLNLPLRAAGDTQYALAQRSLDFRSRTIADLAEVVVRGVVGITCALSGLGPWSLVIGYLSGTLAWTVALWIRVRWRPALRLRRPHLRPLVNFGGPLTVVGIIGTAMSYVDNLFVGRVLGAVALGIYSIGYRLPEMLAVDLLLAAGLVLFPSFAMLDRVQLRRYVIEAARYSFLIALPICAAMITLAHPLVLAVFGPRWHTAAPVIQLLSVGALSAPLSLVTGSAYMATKRVDVMLRLAVPQGLLLLALIAAFVHDGIAAVAACQAGARIAFVPIGLYVSRRVLGLRLRALWNAAWPASVAAVVMAAAIVPIEHTIASPWPALIVGLAVGGAVYIGLAWLLAGDSLTSLWGLARTRAGQASAPRPALAAAQPDLKSAERP